jgi:hypothetical protein
MTRFKEIGMKREERVAVSGGVGCGVDEVLVEPPPPVVVEQMPLQSPLHDSRPSLGFKSKVKISQKEPLVTPAKEGDKAPEWMKKFKEIGQKGEERVT